MDRATASSFVALASSAGLVLERLRLELEHVGHGRRRAHSAGVALGASLVAYRYYSKPVTLSLAVGSFDGERVDRMSPNELVRRGCIQVMEGRHCFAHLSVEENLFTGAFTRRDGSAAIRRDIELIDEHGSTIEPVAISAITVTAATTPTS